MKPTLAHRRPGGTDRDAPPVWRTCAVAALLWFEVPHAAAYSLALLPVEAVFWVGFALPFGPPLGIARVVLAFLA